MSIVLWIVWAIGAAIAFPLFTRWTVERDNPRDSWEYAFAAFTSFGAALMWPLLLVGGIAYVAFAEFGRRMGRASKERVR